MPAKRYLMEDDGLPLMVKVTEAANDKLVTALLASVVASLSTLNFGYALGFTSPTEVEMTSDGTLDADQFSWFSSIVALGAIVGSLLGAYTVQRFGRKPSVMFSNLFYLMGWCLITFGKNPGMLYSGRVISGIGVGVAALCVPMYIAEIASIRSRGGLSCINQLAITFGDVIVYSLGAVDSIGWRWLSKVPIFTSVAAFVLMAFMPETPLWLLSHGHGVKALKNMKWLRGPIHDSEAEISELQRSLDTEETITLRAFFTPTLYRPLIIGCMMMVFQQMVGINAILFFCDDIFIQAGITWHKYASIAAICVLFIFTIFSCLTVDLLGRRILLLVGSVCMFVCMFLLGVYYDLADIPSLKDPISIFGHVSHTVAVSKISWLALLSVFLYLALFAIGWGPLPWVLMGELFPPRARSQASSAVTIVNLAFTFVVGKTFVLFKNAFKQQGTFWFYSGFCLLSFLYTLFFVPETKGKSSSDMEALFSAP